MLDNKRKEVLKDVDECNLRLFGWNKTLNLGEQFFDARMDNQDKHMQNVTARNVKSMLKQDELRQRPKTFFDQIQPLQKPTKEKVLEEKMHGLDYMRESRSEYNHERKLKDLLTSTNVDMVEQLRKERKQEKERQKPSLGPNVEVERLKSNVIRGRYSDLQMSITPSKDLQKSLAQLKAKNNDVEGYMDFYKNKGMNKRFSKDESVIDSSISIRDSSPVFPPHFRMPRS